MLASKASAIASAPIIKAGTRTVINSAYSAAEAPLLLPFSFRMITIIAQPFDKQRTLETTHALQPTPSQPA